MDETKVIETPIGKNKVEIRTYLVGADKRAMARMDGDSGKAQDYMIKRIVVSIDESKEDILERMDKLHGKDFDFIVNAMLEVVKESSLESDPEKKSG